MPPPGDPSPHSVMCSWPVSSLNPILLDLYGGFITQAKLTKSPAFGNRQLSQPPARLHSWEARSVELKGFNPLTNRFDFPDNQSPPLGVVPVWPHQHNKRHLYYSPHLGNFKGFRSSVPEIRWLTRLNNEQKHEATPIPSRFSQCTRSEHLSHASNTSFLLWIAVSQDWTQLGNPLAPLALAGLIHVFSECWLVKSGLGHSWVASFT